MAEIIELEDQIEKVILVGVSEQGGDDAETLWQSWRSLSGQRELSWSAH